MDAEDFNVLLGIVSWATCGDGRSRERRTRGEDTQDDRGAGAARGDRGAGVAWGDRGAGAAGDDRGARNLNLSQVQREQIGKRAKILLDWGRALYLKECGFDARLVYYVPSTVSLENVCIVAKKCS